MRRSLVLGPLLMYATGCALRPFTPAVSVAVYGQETLDAPQTVTVPAKGDAIARWQLPPQNPWASYQKLTLLAALDEVPQAAILPDVAHLDVVDRARSAAVRVAAAGLPNDTIWVVDLRGAAAVVFGALLSRRAAVPPSLVLTFNNWPAENSLIPAEETLAALILAYPQLPDPAVTTHVPVFLLDAWRLAYREEIPAADAIDNRYFLTPTDLPSPEVLTSRGVRRLVYVVEDLDDTETEEDDLNAAFTAYARAGVALSIVDLEMLTDVAETPGGLEVALSSEPLRVKQRVTLVEDPAFYVRARGGFGGLPAGPAGPPSPFSRAYWGTPGLFRRRRRGLMSTPLHGIWGRPYIDLAKLIDAAPLAPVHEEVCWSLARVETSYTGGTLKWMGVTAPPVIRDGYVDAMEAIARFTPGELARFESLADDDDDRDDRERESGAAFGDETDRPFTKSQMLYLKYRYGAYFPWKVVYHLLENVWWDDKNSGEGKAFGEEAEALFPQTVAFIRQLPFREIGRCVIFGLEAHDHAPLHRDTVPDAKAEIPHSISISPVGNKRFFLSTPDLSRRVPVSSRLYWFNDMDWHGVEPDPFFRYSIRVDGVFEPEFVEQLRRLLIL